MAAAPVVRFPVFGLVRLLGLAAAAGILFWAVHYRGGMALSTDEESKLPIFNVHPVLMLIGLVALNGEALLAYKTVPGTKKIEKASAPCPAVPCHVFVFNWSLGCLEVPR